MTDALVSKIIKTGFVASALALLAGCGGTTSDTSATTPAMEVVSDWQLASSDSHLSFVSIKDDELAETHYFRQIEGIVSADGAVALQIDLASVETNIDIRNERMQTMLFETDKYSLATVEAEVPVDQFLDMGIGERRRHEAVIVIAMRGIDLDFDTDLFVTRIGKDRVLVETATPLLLHAADYDLLDGLSALAEVANLPSISPAVPANVSLVFERQS